MDTLKVTAEGQLTLTAELLKHLGMQPGDKLLASELPNGSVELRAAPKGDISNAFGFLRAQSGGRSLSIEEINEIISASWAGER
ncbi:AbrB/MazE/SpoVT family DNA-binding domain-containing protein [Bradyrhizobium sp. CCBAU 51627]|uniref:AbrB/MazE/SpoVT family DNA-binding domain-containing protein n=1 Tax=Bradyrhizobium sp. CCBAU 51627 TaxID=1325088 RepID=UPI002305EF02|nr:AbrB/MazE/SpoVT family DNA-binding domain-containing protein [Bradyrhizobium sp. CCBAU 51627]MDA9432669.1 transcriptional regulator [Bradyrhizobium sp. CCBAU 51627]